MSTPRPLSLALASLLLGCAHPSGTAPSGDVQILSLRPPLVLAQARYTLRAMGYQVVAADTSAAVWATAAVAGHAVVRCSEALRSRVVGPNPVLAIVTARDTVGGSVVQVRVLGWRPGEAPPLTLGMGTSGIRGPCLSTGELERELFGVFRELARRAGPPR